MVKSKIQLRNIASLCSELGFDGNNSARAQKILTEAISDFRTSFIERGHHLSYSTPDSPEAQLFALEFCRDNNRGETLWPPSPNSLWPSWSTDRSTILKALAHIFALQAYYKYQNDHKARKKNMPSTTPAAVLGQHIREMSPESQKYVTPMPPAGTKRRPAKKPESVIELDDDFHKPDIIDTCLDEVQMLNPRNDDKPIIKEFNLQWLSKIPARWPTIADVRVRTFMHNHNLYDPEDPDIKVLPLINSIRKGTEIETCEGGKQFNLLKVRILERVSFIARDLWEKGLLQKEGSTPQKIPEFKSFWQNRHSYWGPKDSPSKSSQKPKNVDVYDINSLPPERTPAYRNPTARMLSKDQQPASSTKSMAPPPTAVLTGTRRKLCATIEDDLQNNQQQKKRKLSTTATQTQALITPPVEKSDASPTANAVEEALREDPITAENVNFAQEYLSSGLDPEPQQRPQYLPRMQSVPKGTRPMTPTSPVVTSRQPDRDSRTTTIPGRAAPVSSVDSGSRNPAPSPGLGAMDGSPARQVASYQSLPTNQRLVLVLEKADGSYNDDDPLPHTHLRDSNVNEFFSLVAKISNKALDSLDCLTFTFMFALGNERVVHKGDEAEWNKLKKKAQFLFTLYRTRLDETEFQLVVEIGDKKNTVTGMDAMWGA